MLRIVNNTACPLAVFIFLDGIDKHFVLVFLILKGLIEHKVHIIRHPIVPDCVPYIALALVLELTSGGNHLFLYFFIHSFLL